MMVFWVVEGESRKGGMVGGGGCRKVYGGGQTRSGCCRTGGFV